MTGWNLPIQYLPLFHFCFIPDVKGLCYNFCFYNICLTLMYRIKQYAYTYLGPGAAYWLRRCSTSRTVPESIPGGITWDFFRGSFRQNHVSWGRFSLWKWIPGISPGVKAVGAFGWRPTTLVVPKVEKIRGLNLPGTPRATSACRRIPLPLLYLQIFKNISRFARRTAIHCSSMQRQFYLHVVEEMLYYYRIITQNEGEIIFYSVRYMLHSSGRGSIDCVTTPCGLDCPGIKSRFRRYFLCLSSPALSPTEPAV
jgi:hypothetical protein